MEFFASAITTLQTLVVALGAGLGVWGVVNLLEGYGSDNPGSKSQGMKQLMAGGGIILLGTTLIPLLSGCCLACFKVRAYGFSHRLAHRLAQRAVDWRDHGDPGGAL